MSGMRLGLALPSFRDDPEVPLRVAAAAEAAQLDGVFAYDHLFRGERGAARPALECFALLGAVAAETTEIGLGSLVARATLRPPALLAHSFDTVQRVSRGRVVGAAIGAGDHESRSEMESFGLGFGSIRDRLRALQDALDACRGRGFPVWIAGWHPQVLALGGHADGWNGWGGSPGAVRKAAGRLHHVAPDLAITWGGLVVVAETDAAARAKADRLGAAPGTLVGGPERLAERLAEYAAAGASWAILGPVDSSEAENATLLGAAVRPLLR